LTRNKFPRLLNPLDNADIHLKGRVVTAGSADSCGVKLDNAMPKRMAHFLFLNGSYHVQSLVSHGPPRLNDRDTGVEPVNLRHGDVIRFGKQEFVYQLHAEDGDIPSGEVNAPVRELIDIIVSLLKDRHREVFPELVSSVSQLLKCDAARLLAEREGEGAETIASFPEGVSAGRFSERAIGWARKAKITILAQGSEWENSTESMNSLRRNLVGSILCTPLRNKERLIGYLYLDRLQGSNLFTEEDREFCDALRPLFEEILIRQEEYQRQKETIARLQELKVASASKIIYESRVMKDVLQMADRISGTETPVFIHGETGTGKELIARYIHENSNRSKGPFIAVNCGAIPENLIESEMFGHEKGSFTGAYQQKKGFFETADNGTLFLDEVGDLPLQLQVKLLRVLQESEICRVGGTGSIKINVRIVSASNRDLSAEVKAGRFREDLFFRLNVLNINIPPLRDRGGDVLLVADYFLVRYCQQFGMVTKKLDASARKALMEYTWPGNIRELDNVIQKTALLSNSDKITREDISMHGSQFFGREPEDMSHMTLKETRSRAEKRVIRHALEKWQGNVSQTAKQLGIDRTWLMKLMKEYDIHPEEFRKGRNSGS
jgi:transcriptional regulator with GAF, ATPase, and Fis domain